MYIKPVAATTNAVTIEGFNITIENNTLTIN